MSLRKGIDSMLEIINSSTKENEPKNDAGGQYLADSKILNDSNAETGEFGSSETRRTVEGMRKRIKEIEVLQEAISRNLNDLSQCLETLENKS